MDPLPAAPDGTWATFYGGPPDLSTTIEAYVALRLAGEPRRRRAHAAAAEFVRGHGGIEGSRVFTRIWLALFGLWPWDDLPVLPPELMFLPPGAPLNIYDFGCWARQTVVALTVVMAHRPARPLPFGIDELRTGAERRPAAAGGIGRPAPSASSTGLVHAYERLPRSVPPKRLLRRLALARAEHWIVRRQEADGLLGRDPAAVGLLDHGPAPAGLPARPSGPAARPGGPRRFTIHDDGAGVSKRASRPSGTPPWRSSPSPTPASTRSTRLWWRRRTGCSARRSGCAATGRCAARSSHPAAGRSSSPTTTTPTSTTPPRSCWPSSRGRRRRRRRRDGANERAVAWTVGMQCRDGGWGAFDADNNSRLCAALPFCDFGEVTDPPSADVTAHVIEMLAVRRPGSPAIGPAVAWLREAQEPDGSWFGRWGVNYVYGTGAAVPALVAAGVARRRPSDPPGGGLAERAPERRRRLGRGPPLLPRRPLARPGQLDGVADGVGAARPARRRRALEPGGETGVAWLVETQRADGTWDEPWFTGTGFPGDFYINYHLYRLVFPVMALGRFVSGTSR